MSHYTWHSLSPSAKVITIYIFRIMAFVAETFLFLYSGFDMWGVQIWRAGAQVGSGSGGLAIIVALNGQGSDLRKDPAVAEEFAIYGCIGTGLWRG